MSKGISGHFQLTKGVIIASHLLSSSQLSMVTSWAESVAKELSLKSKRQRDKFKTACIAVDEMTGRIFYGRNGEIKRDGSNLNEIVKSILPKESLNNYPTTWNCAETSAINKAVNAGVRLSNIHIYTIETSKNNFGRDKKSCKNCTYAYKERIKKNNTGWFE